MSDLGDRLTLARENSGLSAGQVRLMMNWKSPTVLWRYEQGIRTPGKERVEALALIYGVSPAWLAHGTSTLTPGEEARLRKQFGGRATEDQEKAISILRSLRKAGE